jgi:hypothetical protein
MRDQSVPERWLTTADAARMLDLTADGVRWLARQGRLPYERTPAGQRLFLQADVLNAVQHRACARVRRQLRVIRLPSKTGGAPRQLPLFGPGLQLVDGRKGETSTSGSRSESLAIVRKRA